ncbi:hypothetical protein ILP97_11545 [Amycolatopsis sp. H6(2020)]|nr:hypothetical protein [Amycolatopsis sp. H6(2020)]
MQEIQAIVAAATAAFEKFQATEAPDEAKRQAGRWVAGMVGELSNLAWQLEHNPGRWS